MGSKEETTTTRTIPGIGAQERSARAMLMSLSEDAQGQMGDLSDLASGNLQISEQDRLLIQQINELSGEQARKQTLGNYEEVSRLVEDRLLDRNITGASIEAVDQAIMGRQLQQSLDTSTLQQQITSAQQLRQHTIDRAGVQLGANQILLQKLLGGAGAVSQLGLQERLNQGTDVATTETSGLGQVAGTLGQIGGMALGAMTGGASTAVQAAAGAAAGGGTAAGRVMNSGGGPTSQGLVLPQ